MTPLIASRIDRPPVVLTGLTSGELAVAALALAPPSMVVGLGLFAPLGLWPLGLVATLPILALCVAIAARIVRSAKRGRPNNWLKAYLLAWLADRGLIRPPFLRYHGPWEVRR